MHKIPKCLFSLFFFPFISICYAEQIDIYKNNTHWAIPLDEKTNFYNLDNKLFRSEQLFRADYPLLEKHNIKTIINLRFFDRDDDKKAFGKTHLTLINTPLMSWHITPKEVANVLWQIEQAQRNGAVLVHCYHGADRTGLISAVYRIIYQGWNIKEAKREMTEGPYGFHSIWSNIENFFTQKNIYNVKKQLHELGSRIKIN